MIYSRSAYELERRLSNELFESSTRYMASCSSQSGTRWVQLGTFLDRRAAHSDLLDHVEAGAHEAFDCQRSWFGSFRPLARIASSVGAYARNGRCPVRSRSTR